MLDDDGKQNWYDLIRDNRDYIYQTDWDWTSDTNLKRGQKTTAGLFGEFCEASGLPEN